VGLGICSRDFEEDAVKVERLFWKGCMRMSIISRLMGVHSRAPRIFLIGFNRCATRTITTFFRDNGYASVHWGRGSVAAGIELAEMEGKPLLSYTPNYLVYGDLEYVSVKRDLDKVFKRRVFRRLQSRLEKKDVKPIYAYKKFRELHKQYPGSKFILNIRDVDDWIASRIRFLENGYHACDHGWKVHRSQEELNNCWRAHWDNHISAVRKFFDSHQGDLLEFNLDKDGPDKFVNFFPEMNLDVKHWGHYHKTKPD